MPNNAQVAVGAAPNDDTGDALRTAFGKYNSHGHPSTDITGLGTMATQAASAVAITGGTVTGITDLAVADGGTGASTQSAARTNLGLAIGTDVQAYSAQLADLAAKWTAASASGPASVKLAEDTDNGSNTITLIAPASIASDKTQTLQDVTGTVLCTNGADVPLADGGTGASLTDPDADRIMFWDDSASRVDWLSFDSSLSITGTVLSATGGTTLGGAWSPASSAGPASLALAEDTDNGVSTVTIVAPAAIAVDAVITAPATTGTMYVSGGTDVALADGGTGASDAATARTNLGITGTARWLSRVPEGSGQVGPSVIVGATNGRRIEGLGCVDGTTLTADRTWYLVAQPPNPLPPGTPKLRIWSRSLGTGNVIVDPQWASVADAENPDTITLHAEGNTTLTMSATNWEFNEITLDADTVVAGELIVMNLVFKDSGNTSTNSTTHLPSIDWS